MRSVHVDALSRTITTLGGCLWADVDPVAAEHDLVTIGGTISHTSISGLTLGGACGWLSGQHGLEIGNLLSVDLVLADGRSIVVSPNENEDLFWAIRGAGQSFGVATSFTYRAFEQPNPVFAGERHLCAGPGGDGGVQDRREANAKDEGSSVEW
ncbi:MAG: hypothetical protein Q9172_004442 [Xanthocarpia lactea]